MIAGNVTSKGSWILEEIRYDRDVPGGNIEDRLGYEAAYVFANPAPGLNTCWGVVKQGKLEMLRNYTSIILRPSTTLLCPLHDLTFFDYSKDIELPRCAPEDIEARFYASGTDEEIVSITFVNSKDNDRQWWVGANDWKGGDLVKHTYEDDCDVRSSGLTEL